MKSYAPIYTMLRNLIPPVFIFGDEPYTSRSMFSTYSKRLWIDFGNGMECYFGQRTSAETSTVIQRTQKKERKRNKIE